MDGFPPADEVRTVFVETDIQGELSDLSVLDYIYADALLRDCGVPRDEMARVLNSVGFNDESPANITSPVGSLSGGWKMKLALARAMLLKADILLLDEVSCELLSFSPLVSISPTSFCARVPPRLLVLCAFTMLCQASVRAAHLLSCSRTVWPNCNSHNPTPAPSTPYSPRTTWMCTTSNGWRTTSTASRT